jgi:hypothetical protein
MNTIPALRAAGMLWGEQVLGVQEYSFGARLERQEIVLSHEHSAFTWLDHPTDLERLKSDSSPAALWKLNYDLIRSE